MKVRFHVYEIEHGGDEASALAALAKAGCSEIRSAPNFEAEEMFVECVLPAGVASVAELGARCPEVIL